MSHPAVLIRGIAIGRFLLLPVSQTVSEWVWNAVNMRWIRFIVDIGLRQHLNPLTGLLRILLAVPLGIAVGWLVRRSSASPIPAAVVTIIGLQWALAIPSYVHLVFNAIDQPRFLPYAIVNGIGLSTVSASLLTGALCEVVFRRVDSLTAEHPSAYTGLSDRPQVATARPGRSNPSTPAAGPEY